MDKKIAIINIIYALTDTIVCMVAVGVFAFCAWHFDRWWISLFGILPLLLYSNHSMIINADIRDAKVDQLKPDGKGD